MSPRNVVVETLKNSLVVGVNETKNIYSDMQFLRRDNRV